VAEIYLCHVSSGYEILKKDGNGAPGVGGADFVPGSRGRVELGASDTGTGTFVIEFETGALKGHGTPLVIAQPRFVRSG
jgi:hypothetical protein